MAKHSSVSEGFRPLAGCGLFLHYLKRTVSRQRGFRPLAGCGLFRPIAYYMLKQVVSVPLRGVGCFRVRRKAWTSKRFPSPCGVWVVSTSVSATSTPTGFRPLAGCGLFHVILWAIVALAGFPSPCGVWVVSNYKAQFAAAKRFPSPCGVWVVSVRALPPPRAIRGFRPLAGCGLFHWQRSTLTD